MSLYRPAYWAGVRADRRARGVCPGCGLVRVFPGTRCAGCREQAKGYRAIKREHGVGKRALIRMGAT